MKRPRELSKSQIKKTLDLSTSKVQDVTIELEGANKELDDMKLKILVLEKKLADKTKDMMKLEIKNLHLAGVIENLRSNQFTDGSLKIRGSAFQYLSGLSVEKFDLIMQCIN